MYFYLYDSFLGETKYEKEMSEIENFLTDLGITGVIERVSLFKGVKDILRSAVKKSAKTIVVVGDDNTFKEAIKFIPDFEATFGFIPLGEPSFIAHFLGVPQGVEACDVLSARIIEKIDVGKITTVERENKEIPVSRQVGTEIPAEGLGAEKHQRESLRAGMPSGPEAGPEAAYTSSTSKYFLGAVTIRKTRLKLNCDDKYNVILKTTGNVAICNTPFSDVSAEFKDEFMDPRDGRLDLIVSTPPTSLFTKVKGWLGKGGEGIYQSHLTVKKIEINSDDEIFLCADGEEIKGNNFKIGLAREKIKLIIGKNRLF